MRLLGHIPIDGPGTVVPGDSGRKIGDGALATMRAHLHPGRGGAEAGGILIGRYIGGAMIVDEATEPGPHDRASYSVFHRAAEPHASRVSDAWDESDGRFHYLGEWHTHDESEPRPSLVDMVGWRSIITAMADQGFECPHIFIIVGTKSIGVWEGQPGGEQ